MWLQHKLVKFIPHFVGLVDFQFVEFSRTDLDDMGFGDIKIHFNIK